VEVVARVHARSRGAMISGSQRAEADTEADAIVITGQDGGPFGVAIDDVVEH